MKKIVITSTLIGLFAFAGFAQTEKEGKPTKQAPVAKTERAPKTEPAPPAEKETKTAPAPEADKSTAHMEEMDAVVGLSEDQKKQMQKINEEQNEKMKAVRMKYRNADSKEGMNEEVKAIQQERRQRIHQVLTDDQKKKWKEHKKDAPAEKANDDM